MLLQRLGELCVIDVAVVVFVIVPQDVVDEADEVLLSHGLAVLSSLLGNEFTFTCARGTTTGRIPVHLWLSRQLFCRHF